MVWAWYCITAASVCHFHNTIHVILVVKMTPQHQDYIITTHWSSSFHFMLRQFRVELNGQCWGRSNWHISHDEQLVTILYCGIWHKYHHETFSPCHSSSLSNVCGRWMIQAVYCLWPLCASYLDEVQLLFNFCNSSRAVYLQVRTMTEVMLTVSFFFSGNLRF